MASASSSRRFTMEEVMQQRLPIQRAAGAGGRGPNKYARVANRASPLMEALGGFAVAGALIYGGIRVLETGATPGQSLLLPDRLHAGLRARAKRLARLNIELNSALVGVRVLFEIIDHPPTEPDDSDKPALAIADVPASISAT